MRLEEEGKENGRGTERERGRAGRGRALLAESDQRRREAEKHDGERARLEASGRGWTRQVSRGNRQSGPDPQGREGGKIGGATRVSETCVEWGTDRTPWGKNYDRRRCRRGNAVGLGGPLPGHWTGGDLSAMGNEAKQLILFYLSADEEKLGFVFHVIIKL